MTNKEQDNKCNINNEILGKILGKMDKNNINTMINTLSFILKWSSLIIASAVASAVFVMTLLYIRQWLNHNFPL